jgi:UDP-GlcNAc:undecaprenyl-phosphate GlcNAc-1-phosphate transferase
MAIVPPVAFGISLLVTVISMYLLRPLAFAIGLVDRPGGRKLHDAEVPLIGGLAMTAGILAVTLIAGHLRPLAADAYCFEICVCLLAIVGALDDRFELSKSVRILVQLGAALLMVYVAGVQVDDIGTFFGHVAQLGSWSVPFTVVLVMTTVNALNLFDGSNGIAGGQALVALAFYAFAASVSAGYGQWLVLIFTLGACVMGFLVFNWPARATAAKRSFMGDAGSTVLGFALAWLGVEFSQGEARAFSPVCVLWVFALPLFDLFSSVARRLAQGRSPFSADAEHLHHIARRYLASDSAVARVIVGSAAVFAAVGVYGDWMGVPDGLMLISWLIIGVTYYIVIGSGTLLKHQRLSRRAPIVASCGELEQQRLAAAQVSWSPSASGPCSTSRTNT